MVETLQSFLEHLISALNDKNTTLEKKIETIAYKYIDFLSGEPGVPLFILSELRNNPIGLINKLPFQNIVLNSEFIKQYQDAVKTGKVTEPNPLHFLINVMGLVIFPFIAQPMLTTIGKIDDVQFNQMMHERKVRIPIWVKAVMKAK